MDRTMTVSYTHLDVYKRQVYGADIVKIILYGSYARGDYQKDSDIDIVAIVQGNREELKAYQLQTQ